VSALLAERWLRGAEVRVIGKPNRQSEEVFGETVWGGWCDGGGPRGEDWDEEDGWHNSGELAAGNGAVPCAVGLPGLKAPGAEVRNRGQPSGGRERTQEGRRDSTLKAPSSITWSPVTV
jgi:hypothetical protein